MFGNIFGDLEEKQKAMKAKLAEIEIHAEAGDGAVKVKANANQEILDISIDREKLDYEDVEQVQDLIIVAINSALKKASERAGAEAQALMKDMLPPGMGGLGNLFG